MRDSIFADNAAPCAISAVFRSIRLRTNASVILIDNQTTFFPVFNVSILPEIQEKNKSSIEGVVEVRWFGYVALVVAILFFSGIFTSSTRPIRALDFTNVSGGFGTLGKVSEEAGTLAANFRGSGGTGVKDGWLFALTLFPTVMFALGVVKMVEHMDGLKA